MSFDNEHLAGLIYFFGTLQVLFVVHILSVLEPGYSISAQVISELGLGTNAVVFNTSLMVWGITEFVMGFFFYRANRSERLFAILIMVAGIGVVIGGLAPMGTPFYLHLIGAHIGLDGTVIAILLSLKFMKPPYSYVQLCLGGLGLVADILLILGMYMGLGLGGMQRVMVYTLFIWAFSFSTYLLTKPR